MIRVDTRAGDRWAFRAEGRTLREVLPDILAAQMEDRWDEIRVTDTEKAEPPTSGNGSGTI